MPISLNQYEIWKWIKSEVSEETLTNISNVDYGFDAVEHLSSIRAIFQSGDIPNPLEWVPHEVLALARWGDWNSDARYIVDKSTVLFASFVLLHSVVIRANQVDELATNLVILTEVCESYGPNQLSLLAEYLESVRQEFTLCDTEKIHLDVGLWILLALLERDDKAAQTRRNIRAGLIGLVEQEGYPKERIMDQYSHVMHASTIEGYLGKLKWEEFDPFEIWNDSNYGGLKNGEQ